MRLRLGTLSVGFGLVTFLVNTYGFAQESSDENTAQDCRDLVDNDGDGFIDCTDQDCGLFTFCSEDAPSDNYKVQSNPTVTIRDGKGLFISGMILSTLGVVAGSASLGLATRSTEDDAFLFSSIGVGVSGWIFSSIGGGLMIGGQARDWKTVRQFGGQPKSALLITGIAMYGLMSIGGAVVSALGPTVGPATGVGSAPFWGPMLVLEVAAYSVLVPGGAIASRNARKAAQGTSSMSIRPFLAKTRETGVPLVGLSGSF